MRIVIPGSPIAKARPKFSTQGCFPRAYDSQAKLVKDMRFSLARQVKEMELTLDDIVDLRELPLHVSLEYHMPIPESATAASQSVKLWNLELPFIKPDIDNLIKWTFDLLNGIIWYDDAQIVKLEAKQKYSLNPCTIIEINTIDLAMDEDTIKIVKLFSPDEMSEFYCDTSLLADAIGRMELSIAEEKYLFLSPIAEEIIRFSALYSKKLSKIAKLAKNEC